MKLKKLLLPVATIASTVAVVAPIITSCGKGGNVNAQKLFDGEFERSENTVLSEDAWKLSEATKNYMDAVKHNPKIFSDDVFDFVTSILNKELFSKIDMRFANVKGSLGIQTSDYIAEESQGTPIYKASAKVNVNISVSDIKIPEYGEQDLLHDAKFNLSGSLELKNLRFKVGPAGNFAKTLGYDWGMCLDYTNISSMDDFLKEDWAIKSNLNLSASKLFGFTGNVGLDLNIDKNSSGRITNVIGELFVGVLTGGFNFGLGSLNKIDVKGE